MEEEYLIDNVNQNDLKRAEIKFNEELNEMHVTDETQFEYAWCLIRSSFTSDVFRGIRLFEELKNNIIDQNNACKNREVLYFLAIGHTKIKQYDIALNYCKELLQEDPNCQQILRIENFARIKLEEKNRKSVAILSGAALVIGGLVSLGLALVSR